jgi:hypothetical protein
VFSCPGSALRDVSSSVDAYLTSIGVDMQWVRKTNTLTSVIYTLAPELSDSVTLDLIDRPSLNLREEKIDLPASDGTVRTVLTVSQKEIAYALMQSGRRTVFEGDACSGAALADHIGIRQNTVAWAEQLHWEWPDGQPAAWNKKYWKRGDLRREQQLSSAVNDAFIHQDKYSIGCYTATKLVEIQGVLDYYGRIKKDPITLQRVQDILLADKSPLTGIEPGIIWSFEEHSTPTDQARPGKILQAVLNVAPKNFVPGDWSYFLNTDPASYAKTGYEGSNAIYLGRGKFDDYYNDHNHAYTYPEKLHEVYQWRHGVFSTSRDTAKVHPLSAADLEQLGRTPDHGGLELNIRLVPQSFTAAVM